MPPAKQNLCKREYITHKNTDIYSVRKPRDRYVHDIRH